MTYRKVVFSGNVLEIYEFEKEPGAIEKKELDDYDALDLEKTKLTEDGKEWIYEEMKELRSKNRRKQTVRDARNITRRLALMNFGTGDKFLTLTFDPKRAKEEDMRSIDFVDKEFKKFIQRFNYKFDVKLQYIAVREFHKSGRLHLHMLCRFPFEFEGEEDIKYWERFIGETVWKHGFVDIKVIDHVDNVGAYLIKYMTKNLAVELFKGKKVYLCSKGLERPLIYRGDEAERIIAFYELEKKKEVFTNSYESEYLGTICYKEYNLKRY
ncbi:TPA: hypothetical protein NJY08_005250 [Salmonella enterica subsp. enterica serovar Typhi str. AG3]|nr:hypothetical protein [Salmonella enterica subsp. enterica serovar Typhi str. AG3]